MQAQPPILHLGRPLSRAHRQLIPCHPSVPVPRSEAPGREEREMPPHDLFPVPLEDRETAIHNLWRHPSHACPAPAHGSHSPISRTIPPVQPRRLPRHYRTRGNEGRDERAPLEMESFHCRSARVTPRRARDESRFCELCADPLEDSVGCRGAVERLGIVSLLEPEEGRESGDTEPQLQERCRFVILLVKIEERKEHCLPANPLHALKLLGSPLEVGACLAALAAPRRSEHHQDVSVRLHRCFQRGRINHPDSFRICGRRC
mmetsp:Transcript_3690/g.8788  ORF Transcript_3690/g.8788 Transcript_3690/m.8788 type:complete len:261 (-) Transcript_3690:191-973(-)